MWKWDIYRVESSLDALLSRGCRRLAPPRATRAHGHMAVVIPLGIPDSDFHFFAFSLCGFHLFAYILWHLFFVIFILLNVIIRDSCLLLGGCFFNTCLQCHHTHMPCYICLLMCWVFFYFHKSSDTTLAHAMHMLFEVVFDVCMPCLDVFFPFSH